MCRMMKLMNCTSQQNSPFRCAFGRIFCFMPGQNSGELFRSKPVYINVRRGLVRRGREIIGLPIIDLATGLRVAEVRDLICDQEALRVTALLVEKGSLVRSAKALAWEDIHSVGSDAVTIKSAKLIKTVGKTGPSPGNRYMYKQVITTSGQYLGRIDDIAVNTSNGRILGCVLTDGILGDFISGKAIIPLVESAKLSAENMIVPNEPVDLSFRWGVDDEVIEMPDVQ